MSSTAGAAARDRRAAIAGRWTRGLRRGERALAALLLVASMFTFPEYPAVSLDPSWRLVLAHAFYGGLQFGREIVFTYGPLGFLMGNTYDGAHFWPLIAWQLIRAVAFAAVILHAVERLPVVARLSCVGAFLLFGVYFEDTLHLMIVVLLGLELVREDGRPGPRAGLAIGAGLAGLSAIKFPSLLLAATAVMVAAGLHLWRGRRLTAGALVLGYAGGFVAIWVLARQSLGVLPDYLVNAWRLSRGYEEAMGLAPPAAALEKALAVGALLSLSLGLQLALNWRQPRAVAGVLLMAAFGFVTWKHGFIRADGHMGGFFISMLLPATAAPALLAGTNRWRPVQWGVLALAGLVSIWGLDDTFTVTRANAWAVFTGRLCSHADHLAHWRVFRASYDEELRRQLAARPLARTRERVENASIDVLGHEAGLVCLHGMNYRPRPVFQGYSVHTPALAQLNREFLLSTRAPDFLLQKLQTIDGRLLTLDDGWVLRLLPQLYEFVLAEDGFLLWQRRPARSAATVPPPQRLLAGEQAPGEALRVDRFADQPLWLELDLPLSLLGRLRTICYHPPLVHLRLTDTAGGISDYRLPLSHARGGFIVNPIIDDAADYLTFVGGESRRRLQSLTLVIESGDRGFFADQCHFTLAGFPLPRLERPLGSAARRVRFHMFTSVPASETAFAPFTEEEIDGQPVIVAHAPSEMRFALSPRASRIAGRFGFTPGAYTEGGRTDGATFQVVWTDGQQREVLFSRHLDPTRVAADQGLQSFSVELRGRNFGQLLLQVSPGPAGDNSWDWTVWSGVEIQERP